jgi:hypothetical protein
MQIWLLRQGWVINYCVIAAMLWPSGVDLFDPKRKSCSRNRQMSLVVKQLEVFH